MVVGWRPDLSGMRALTSPEVSRAFHGGPSVTIPKDASMVVP